MKKIILGLAVFIGTLFAAPTMAPQFEATTITGEKVSLNGFLETKKPTLVYFTASWCPTCAKNWPSINSVYKTYKDRVNFVSISIDPTDTNEVLTKLAKTHDLVYPSVAGNPKIMVDFGVTGQATTIMLNSKGEITFKDRGHLTLEEYTKIIEDSLSNE
ncbi:TlpA family protein disulfide reductase [Poseidonibacter antarcticus]|uniref:TlpA family protein disulfide reductase n=1 Tax=Poseidonibacter antarcticus TaxID=2478538 RepID=UPI000EF45E3E|nr:TlpA disulfide reductase family protein [Poseidonibacter antarcticus]